MSIGRLCGTAGWIWLVACGGAGAAEPRVGPLPIATAGRFVGHAGRIPIALSPDGKWVAHTYVADEMLPTDASPYYSTTGISLTEGPQVRHARLTHTLTAETIDLAPPGCSSWAAVWSHGGSQLAFFSDEGGEPGLWLWDLATRQRHRLGKTIAWPRFGFEAPRWLHDGRHLLCPILPAGSTVAAARMPMTDSDATPDGAQTGVTVRYSPPRPGPNAPAMPFSSKIGAVLALVDVTTGEVTAVSAAGNHPWYAASPDDRYLAWTANHAMEANSQQNTYDLFVYDRIMGTTQAIASGLRMGYGITLSWAPNSRRIACLTGGQLAPKACAVFSVDGRPPQVISLGQTPEALDFEKERPPLWDARGETLWCIQEGELWGLNLATGEGKVGWSLATEDVTGIVSAGREGQVWSGDGSSSAWLFARNKLTHNATIHRVDLVTGKSEKIRDEPCRYLTSLSCDASDDPPQIVLMSEDAAHPPDLWRLDIASREIHQVSHLNPDLEGSAAGASQQIEWKTSEGQILQGALLLPAGHQPGQRHPLVVWVYGGTNGANYLNQYGFLGSTPVFNFQILASRGYAVFFPDLPLRVGQNYQDLPSIMLPALDRLVELGFAEPQRMAIMGQSFGSYCALSLLTQTQRFHAAIVSSIALHPDLVSAYLAGNSGYFEHGQGGVGGTPWDNREGYLKNSPIYAFDRIETPILLSDGTNDGRGPQNAEAVFNALQRLGKSAEYRLYEREGHVIAQSANVIDFWERRLAFLAEHLDLVLDEQGAIIMAGDRPRSRRAAPPTTR